jgi:hypothetical protein
MEFAWLYLKLFLAAPGEVHFELSVRLKRFAVATTTRSYSRAFSKSEFVCFRGVWRRVATVLASCHLLITVNRPIRGIDSHGWANHKGFSSGISDPGLSLRKIFAYIEPEHCNFGFQVDPGDELFLEEQKATMLQRFNFASF